MNKKILGGLLIGSVIVLPLSVVALSLNTSPKISEVTTPQAIKYDDGGLDPREVINKIAANIDWDYEGKEKLWVHEADLGKVTASNYDKETFKVNVKKIEVVEDTFLIWVYFTLKNEKTGETSREISTFITGFRTS